MYRRRRRRPKWLRLFLFFIIVLSVLFLGRKAYDYYELRCQISEAEQIRQELQEEKADLEKRKQELNDPAVIERKARDDLGMVKPGEVPYVK